MSPNNRLFFCLSGVLVAGCALPKMDSDWNGEGAGNAGGIGQGGGSSAGNGTVVGGTNSAGNASSNGGTSGAGQAASAGGTLALGGTAGTATTAGGAVAKGGTSAAGSTSTSGGGVTNTGGLSSTAGSKATGGVTNTGGTSTGAGATSTGVVTSTGGAPTVAGTTSTGGVTSTGGAPTVAGTTSTGGVTSTGGASTVAGTTSTGGAAGAAGSSGKLTAIAVSAGQWHTCAVMSDGTVSCWGNNCDGRLGDGGVVSGCASTAAYRYTPFKVSGVTQATAIASGGFHTCAIVGRAVQCWGYNGNGQLGNDSNESSSNAVNVIGITTAKAIAAGERHTCALLEDEAVQCWGQNLSSTGQLGDGTSTQSGVPVTVVTDRLNPPTPLGSVAKIAATWNHTCALKSTGEVYCWGDNLNSQLGNESIGQYSNIAVRATRIVGTATNIGAGEGHSCAVFADGSTRCWGYGGFGELGDDRGISSEIPVTVAFTPTFNPAHLVVGGGNGCAILPNVDRTVQCWGNNGNGEVGNGVTALAQPSPASVKMGAGSDAAELKQVQSVGIGHAHSCAIVTGGAVHCWGYNKFGQLGTGNALPSSFAKLVSGF